MTAAALESDVQTLWWVTLGVGLVVAIVVVALLQILLSAVRRIRRNVDILWAEATTLARNTSTTWLLAATGDSLEELKNEALRHDDFLSDGGRR